MPVHAVPEFINYAKANPGKLNMASAGIGSGNHLFGELFKLETRIELAHVKYRGAGSALVDLLAGHAQVMFGAASSSMEFVKTGKLRALAVTTNSCRAGERCGRQSCRPETPDTLGRGMGIRSGEGAAESTPPSVPGATPRCMLGRSSWQQCERFALPQLGPRCAQARSRSTGRCRRGSRPRSSLRRRPRRRLQRRGLGKQCRRYV